MQTTLPVTARPSPMLRNSYLPILVFLAAIVEVFRQLLPILLLLLNTESRLFVSALLIFMLDTAVVVVWGDGKRHTLRQALSCFLSQVTFLFIATVTVVSLTIFGNAFPAFGWLIEASYFAFCLSMIRSIFANAPRLARYRSALAMLIAELKDRNYFVLASGIDPNTPAPKVEPAETNTEGTV